MLRSGPYSLHCSHLWNKFMLLRLGWKCPSVKMSKQSDSFFFQKFFSRFGLINEVSSVIPMPEYHVSDTGV